MKDRKALPFDIDIDVSSHIDKTKLGVRAMTYNEKEQKILPHPCGYYPDPKIEVPTDPLTGLAAIDYKDAEQEYGLVKVDVLTNTAYDIFQSKEELRTMAKREPNWNLLLKEEILKQLPHIANHRDILEAIKPRSIIELADVLALIRPGKRHLVDEYAKEENRKAIRRKLYQRPTNGKHYFKKSHAVSYAVMIVAIVNKLDLFSVR